MIGLLTPRIGLGLAVFALFSAAVLYIRAEWKDDGRQEVINQSRAAADERREDAMRIKRDTRAPPAGAAADELRTKWCRDCGPAEIE